MLRGLATRRSVLRAALGAAVAAVAPLGLGKAIAAPAPGNAAPRVGHTTAGSYCLQPVEWRMLELINAYRRAHGRRPLRASAKLCAAAEHHSKDMARTGYFSHTLPSGTSWSTNVRNHGYRYNTYIGENIAGGYASATSTFTQWKNSPGHRANMLSPNFTAIGIGRAYNGRAQWDYYWTTTFGGVQDAGTC